MSRIEDVEDVDAEILKVTHSKSTRKWVIEALESALKRDPVDAAADAELVAELLERRCRAMLCLPWVDPDRR